MGEPFEEGAELTHSHSQLRLLSLAVWLGLVYGLIEAFLFVALGFVPGALSWRTGNSAYVLAFAPLFYAFVFAAVALLSSGLAFIIRRAPWDSVLVALLVGGGAFLATTLPGLGISDLAAGVLGAGVGVAAARLYRRRRAAAARLVRRTLPALAAAVLVLFAGLAGVARTREALALRRLPEPATRSQNVLLLVLDTQRADHLSSYGYPRATSPHLDSLARQGVLFENAYATSSWTLPTHATMMTGRALHEHRAGVMRRPYLDDRFPTLAEFLQERGYATGGFIANTFWVGRQTGLDRGFIHYEDFWGSLGDAVARTVLGRRLAYEVLPRFGLIDVPGRKWAADVNADLLRWIDALGERPFFAFVNYFDVHGPYLPPEGYRGRFSAVAPVSERPREIDIGALSDDITLPDEAELRSMVDRYDESIAYLDSELGRLFEALDDRGLFDNTVIIVTSDHGESWGEHGMMYHGHSLYREQLHIPMIVRSGAGLPVGERVSQVVGVAQIPTTIAELLGFESSFPQPSMFQAATSPPAVLAELARRSMVDANWPSSRGWLAAVVTRRWQFTLYESGAEELYELESDPQQLHNLADEERTSFVLRSLRADLHRRSEPGVLDWRVEIEDAPAVAGVQRP
ncbi:MAG: sulfatase [Longimicrobiales bacterium]